MAKVNKKKAENTVDKKIDNNVTDKKFELNIPDFLKDDNYIFIIILAVFMTVLLLNKLYIEASLATAIILLSVLATIGKHNIRKRKLNDYIIDITNKIDEISISSLFTFPMPTLIINSGGGVCWYNSVFKSVSGEELELKNIKDIVVNFPLNSLEESNEGTLNNIISIVDGKSYTLLFSKLNEEQFVGNASYILYWIDNTAYTTIKNKYNDERPIAIIVQVDNYEEISEKMDKVIRASMLAEIERRLGEYASQMNGFVTKFGNSKFLLVIENRFLEDLETKKFAILEEVKTIQESEENFFTLSIGVGAYGNTIGQLYDFAKGAMDIALARGGDQAVVKRNSSVKFYGGRSNAVEKRTKVRARSISYALRQIVDQSSCVVIMGHRMGDMDSLGSSLGLRTFVKKRGKKAYIVLNDINHAVKNLYDRIQKDDPDCIEDIITTEQALKIIDADTVCAVLDTHKGSFTEAPEVLEKIDKVVLIDHHRRGEEYLDRALLEYLEPYASSTCELITELLQYLGDDVKLSKLEADAMLAGIVVDTNSFIFKTGVRTFEAASFLRRNGADTIEVKELFSEPLDTMKRKTEIIDRAEMKFGDIAVSYIKYENDDNNVIAAKAADELLTIKDVNASFVLLKKGEQIHISGRSLGKISVQLILEQLGGGGHLTVAGAQLNTTSIDDAKEQLYAAIKHYKEDGVEQ